MRKLTFVVATLVLFLLVSCSQDNTDLVTYKVGKETKSLKIAQVKDELVNYVTKTMREITNNVTWHQEYFINNHLALDFMLYEQLEAGLTNTPEQYKKYQNMLTRQQDKLLVDKSQEYFKEDISKGKVECVRVYHILISDMEGSSEKEALALNILDSLKASKSLKKDFINIAKDKSDDKGSGMRGGDLGFFPRGVMVPEFENAAFSSSKGLVPELVKTQFGYHILLIDEARAFRTLNDIAKKDPTYNEGLFKPIIEKEYYAANTSNNVVELFKIDGDKIVVGDKSYTINELPDNVNLFKVYNFKYTYKQFRDVVDVYVEGFSQNVTLQTFVGQLYNFKGFVAAIDKAKMKNYHKSAEFKKEYANITGTALKYLAAQEIEQVFRKQAAELVVDADLQKYYDANKSTMVKQGQAGEQIFLKYEEVKDQVREELIFQKVMEIYSAWKLQMIAKYQVQYSDIGWKALQKIEIQAVEKFEKKELEAKRKNLLKE